MKNKNILSFNFPNLVCSGSTDPESNPINVKFWANYTGLNTTISNVSENWEQDQSGGGSPDVNFGLSSASPFNIHVNGTGGGGNHIQITRNFTFTDNNWQVQLQGLETGSG